MALEGERGRRDGGVGGESGSLVQHLGGCQELHRELSKYLDGEEGEEGGGELPEGSPSSSAD